MSNSVNKKNSPANAVRVWRGFQLATLSPSDFYDKLGSVFVPATVKLQIEAGLHSYTPTVPAGLPDKPAYVPDETAILFWHSQETYWNGFSRLAVRTYTLTHNGVYITKGTPLSRADFPIAYDGASTLSVDQPVFLFNTQVDWMTGAVRHLVAERPRSVDSEKFKMDVSSILNKIKNLSPSLQGAIACIGDDYLVYWELGEIAAGVKTPVSGVEMLQSICSGWNHVFHPAPTYLPISIYDEWPGMDVGAGSSFNMQFNRSKNF